MQIFLQLKIVFEFFELKGGKIMKGYAGKILRIDLSRGKISTSPSASFNGKYLGGRGVGAWILFNEVPPETPALDPKNIMIFGTGPLTGTSAPSSGRLSLVTKNAVSKGFAYSNAGGHFAPELKYAGYDHLIISGKSPFPAYLIINNDTVKLKKADFIWGKDVWETEDTIKSNLLQSDLQILSIGPGGENLSKCACIMINKGRALGFGGCGAVMGSKNLKAIVVKGSKSIEAADPSGFMQECQKSFRKIDMSIGANFLRQGGTIAKVNPSFPLPTRNYQDANWGEKNLKVEEKKFSSPFEIKRSACFNCSMRCSHFYSIPNDTYAGLVCEGIQTNAIRGFGSNLDIDDPAFIIAANSLCNKLGLHIDEISSILGWAFECFEKGILTCQDTDGLELNWGNQKVALELIRKIGYRESFGNILAEGVAKASQIIGSDSQKYAMSIKNTGINEGGIRIKKAWALGIATSTRGGGHLCGSPNSEGVKSITPEIGKKRYGVPTAGNVITYEGKAKLVVWFEKYKAVIDSLGMCCFTSYWQNNLLGPNDYANLFYKITGKPIDKDKLFIIGEKILNIEKAYNTLSVGFSRKDDFFPDRFIEEPVKQGPYKGERLDKESWNNLLTEYYSYKGWDTQTGWQTEECLEKLGLEKLKKELEKVGRLIINGNR